MKREYFGVYGETNDGDLGNLCKIFASKDKAVQYAKSQYGKIAWGYPRIYKLKKIYTFQRQERVEYLKGE